MKCFSVGRSVLSPVVLRGGKEPLREWHMTTSPRGGYQNTANHIATSSMECQERQLIFTNTFNFLNWSVR